eukprot:3309136-Amphidinium_carterae.1
MHAKFAEASGVAFVRVVSLFARWSRTLGISSLQCVSHTDGALPGRGMGHTVLTASSAKEVQVAPTALASLSIPETSRGQGFACQPALLGKWL